ncbi:MAG: transporter [Pseudomonadota bacterium]
MTDTPRALAAFIAVLAAGGGACAEDEPGFSAERPGFSTSPFALSRSGLQLEAGYLYSGGDAAETRRHTAPQTLFRAGLGGGLEAQFGWGGVAASDQGGEIVGEQTTGSFALKWSAAEQSGARPALGFLAGGAVPIDGGDVDPFAGALYAYGFESGLGLFGTVLATAPQLDGERRAQTSISNGLGVPAGPRTSLFVEHLVVATEDEAPAHVVDGGVAFMARANLQLDLHGGVGLNDAADDYFISTGLAVRW